MPSGTGIKVKTAPEPAGTVFGFIHFTISYMERDV